jgi:hypothetical protein
LELICACVCLSQSSDSSCNPDFCSLATVKCWIKRLESLLSEVSISFSAKVVRVGFPILLVFCRCGSSLRPQIRVHRFSGPYSPHCSLKQDLVLCPGIDCRSDCFLRPLNCLRQELVLSARPGLHFSPELFVAPVTALFAREQPSRSADFLLGSRKRSVHQVSVVTRFSLRVLDFIFLCSVLASSVKWRPRLILSDIFVNRFCLRAKHAPVQLLSYPVLFLSCWIKDSSFSSTCCALTVFSQRRPQGVWSNVY